MNTAIKGDKAFSYIEVELAPNEAMVTESDAMSSMDAEIDLRAALNGGLISGLLRKFLGGESLFINRFENNTQQHKRLILVQPTPGEIKRLQLDNEVFNLQPGAFIACTPGVKLSLRWAGFVSFIAGEGLFKLQVSGKGDVFYGAYGALIEKPLDGELIVDTSHLVGYGPGIQLKLQLAGGLFGSLFGGEGLVTRVQGKGNIVIQSRSISGLSAWLNPKFR